MVLFDFSELWKKKVFRFISIFLYFYVDINIIRLVYVGDVVWVVEICCCDDLIVVS